MDIYLKKLNCSLKQVKMEVGGFGKINSVG